MKLSRFLLYVLLTSWLNLAFASTTTASAHYKPQVGQEGKDMIWVPTPEGLIEKMLAAAKVSDKDTLFDLGAGDGIIAITATRQYGAKSVGIKYNPEMAQFARRKVAEAGMTARCMPALAVWKVAA
jgi:2-polyprenyl-3-methyl-5-hydroxy-6-metoxy-1,4-benzoquinol methylase